MRVSQSLGLWTACAVLLGGMTALGGCATARSGTRTCGVILLMDGQHLIPSKKQFDAVVRSVGPQFERHALVLIPDLVSAKLLATIECRPSAEEPGRTDLIVRDVGRNTFSPKPEKLTHPTLDRAEREYLDSLRGLNRPVVN